MVDDLVLVEEFLNTVDQRTFRWHGENHVPSDRLTSVEALAEWFGAHDLDPGRELGPADLEAAVALRASLRDAVLGGTTTGFPLRLAPDADGRLRITADTGVAGFDRMIETVATSVATGAWGRLKLCSASDCRWAFYDTSRNGGGRWCRMEACGNRNKTRAYRQRQDSAPDPG